MSLNIGSSEYDASAVAKLDKEQITDLRIFGFREGDKVGSLAGWNVESFLEFVAEKLKREAEKDRSHTAALTAIQQMQERYMQLQEDIAALNKKIADEEAAIEAREEEIDDNQSELDKLIAEGKGDTKEADDLRNAILLLQNENDRGHGRIGGWRRDIEDKEREAEDLEREYASSGGDPNVLEEITQKALQKNDGNEIVNIAGSDGGNKEIKTDVLKAKGHDKNTAIRTADLRSNDEIRLTKHQSEDTNTAGFMASLKLADTTSTGSPLDGSRKTSVISANFDLHAAGSMELEVANLAVDTNGLQVAELSIETVSTETTLGLSTTTLG